MVFTHSIQIYSFFKFIFIRIVHTDYVMLSNTQGKRFIGQFSLSFLYTFRHNNDL